MPCSKWDVARINICKFTMKFLSNLFTGKIDRFAFLVGFIISFILFIILCLLIPTINYQIIQEILVVIFLGIDIFFFSLLVRRMQNMAWSLWSLLWLFVPFVNFYILGCLFLKRGTLNEKDTQLV